MDERGSSRQEVGLALRMHREAIVPMVLGTTNCDPDTTMQSEPENPSYPQHIGRYQITGVLGKGAMGVVYKAIDPHFQRTVALKTINKAGLLDSAEWDALLVRFQQEAQAAGKLNQHDNVVGVFDYGEDRGSPYIVMEYVEGRELKSYLEEGKRFSIPESVRIMGQVLDALSHCHSRGVIHRDLKPGNIFLLEDGRAKIADFGIARIESSTLTQTGAVLGTPSYMSPEQFMGQAVDARADLYCAGVLLYELLTGEKPFVGQSVTAIMHKLLSSEPIDPTKLNLSLSETFDPLIRKALAKKPDARFQTAEEFKQALNLAAKKKQVSPADADETLPPSISVPKPRPGWRMKNRLWLLAVAVVLALGAVVITPRLIQPGPTPPSAGLVNVISDPPGAKILLDGQFVGLTPKEIAKPAGEYAIVLQKAGYQDLRAKLMVEPSADVDFDVILSEAGE